MYHLHKGITLYYAEDSISYYAKDGILYYAEVSTLYYARRYLVP